MNYPQISIVTPSYNQAKFLEETICSVLDQGYPNLQYVIVDGGSQDGSVDIIKKYEKYLWWWVSEPDRGHGHALNKGFSHTTGEIMAWLNSDDKYREGAFQAVAEIFSEHSNVNWIVGKNGEWNASGDFVYERFVYKNVFDFLLWDYGWIQQESTFWRKSLWQAAGGYINENYRFMVDGELWTRFFLMDELWHINQVLSGYRTHGDNRAILYLKEVKNEMEQAIRDLAQKLESSVSIMDIMTVIRDTDRLYTENLSLHYNVIDRVNEQWHKKQIDYFAVKAKESLARENYHELNLTRAMNNFMNKRLLIWGTGNTGHKVFEQLRLRGEDNLVVGFIDNNNKKWDSLIYGRPIYSPIMLNDMGDDCTVIIASIYYNEIVKQIEAMGFTPIAKDCSKSVQKSLQYIICG
jgi:glycosyltransferase involved in cell wall biosynthesis